MALKAEDGGRAFCGNWFFESGPNGFAFSLFGGKAYDFFGGAQRGNCQGKGVVGDGVEGGEVSFADLLLFAGGVEFHDFDLARVFKVGDWRVVEGEVTVFSNAQAAEVDGCLDKQAFVAIAFVQREQGVAGQVVEGLGFGLGFDAFFHVALKAGDVARRQSEIFVHVEKLDS